MIIILWGGPFFKGFYLRLRVGTEVEPPDLAVLISTAKEDRGNPGYLLYVSRSADPGRLDIGGGGGAGEKSVSTVKPGRVVWGDGLIRRITARRGRDEGMFNRLI